MSRQFGAAVTDVVNVGTPSQYANLAALTYLAFINPTGFGNPSAGRILSKANASGSGHDFFIRSTSGGQIVVNLSKSISDAQAVAPFAAALFNNEWKLVAATYVAGDGGPRLWFATHGVTLPVEMAYTSRTDGSGTIVDVSALALLIGNSAAAGGNAFQGRLADIMVFPGVISAKEIQRALLAPRTQSHGGVTKAAHWPLDFVLDKGTKITDVAGGGAAAAGTVTGAVVHANPARETQGSSGW